MTQTLHLRINATKTNPSEDLIKCKVCGRKYKSINGTHLKTHSMTMREYRQKFPSSKMLSEAWMNSLVNSFTSRERSLMMIQAWNEGKFEHRKNCSPALKEHFAKTPLTPEQITYRNACHSRAKRIKNGYLMIVKDNNGNSVRLQFTSKRDERPLAQYNGGAVYRDNTIFPCLDEEDLKTLVQRYAAIEGFSLPSLSYQVVRSSQMLS